MHDTTAWHWPEIPPSSDLISLSSTVVPSLSSSTITNPSSTSTSAISKDSAVNRIQHQVQEEGATLVKALATEGDSGFRPLIPNTPTPTSQSGASIDSPKVENTTILTASPQSLDTSNDARATTRGFGWRYLVACYLIALFLV